MSQDGRYFRAIVEADWPSIMRIQSEAYYEFEPETEVVMRSKASHSPVTCFVAADDKAEVLAYCLAHPYPPNRVAVLGTICTESENAADNLYIHDVAVQNASAGCGIAKALFDHLTEVARLNGFRTMSLVAVQQANGFWSRMGFTPSSEVTVGETYASGSVFMTRDL